MWYDVEKTLTDGGNNTADEREKKTSVLEAHVVEHLCNPAFPCQRFVARKKMGNTYRGTDAPMQERIKVLAATAEAA